MNVKELIGKYEYMSHACFRRVDTLEVLKDLRQLDEPQKLKIPQFVSEYIEQKKDDNYHLLGAMDTIMTSRRINLYEWFYDDDNIELFARAWLDGYEIEEEKRYTVVMKVTKQPLYYNALDDKLFFSMGKIASHFTQQQLEKLNFGWVFDCEGIEIEEVTE